MSPTQRPTRHGRRVGERAVIAAPTLLRTDATHSAAAVAHALVDLFESVAGLACKVSWVQRETECQLAELGEHAENAERADPALAAAARAIAQAIDADAALRDRQPNHGRQHFCEGMLTASLLCRVHRLPCRSAQPLLLSAFIHDLAHDGKRSLNFRLERGSIGCATPYLMAAGIDAETRLRLAALVLATEPHHGVRAAWPAQDFHATGAVCASHADGASELVLLGEDAQLSRLAMLLLHRRGCERTGGQRQHRARATSGRTPCDNREREIVGDESELPGTDRVHDGRTQVETPISSCCIDFV